MPPEKTHRLPARLLSACALALGGASLAFATQAPATFGIAGPPRPVTAKAAPAALSKQLAVDVSRAPQTALSRIDRERIDREDAVLDHARAKGIRYGVGRAVSLATADGDWTTLADGSRFWVAEVTSPEAIGLRLHFVDLHLPPGARLAVYAADLQGHDPAKNPVEVHGGPLGLEQADLWTGSMPGERARIEYIAPPGAPAQVPFRVDRLEHLYRNPLQIAKDQSGSCESDVACSPDYLDLSHAVAGFGTVGSPAQDAIFCSGQLLNTQSGDFSPIFDTAHHCTAGSNPASYEFYWNFQAASCGGNAPSIFDVPHSVHATMLSTSDDSMTPHDSDYALLMVDGAIPSSDLFWAGWTAEKQVSGEDAVAIHHPEGDVKKISFGTTDLSDLPHGCNQPPPNGFGNTSVVQVRWNDGVTEPGSSGSGIFRTDTRQLFGQLFGGPSSCDASPDNRYDCYGAFATTYSNTAVANALKGGSDDKMEPNDTCGAAKALRNGRTRNLVLRVTSPDWYKVFVPAHNTAKIAASFKNAWGDIDLAGYATCGASPIAIANGTGDGEVLTIKNAGKKGAWFYVNVYFGDEDTRANYDLNVSYARTAR